jgi:hypothetical protein
VRVTVVSHSLHAKVWVSAPASLGRLLGTIRWSRMGLLQFGHLGVSIEACDNEVIGGHFACRQGRLPYTCPIETPYGRSAGDMRLPPASADNVSRFGIPLAGSLNCHNFAALTVLFHIVTLRYESAMGRKPIGDTAMSSAERQRRYRQARSREDGALEALERNLTAQAGRIASLEARNAVLQTLLNKPQARLSKSTKQRLAKVCGMLGSAFAGERAAAAKMATDILRKEGITWDDVML